MSPKPHTHFKMIEEVFTGELPWQTDSESHKLVKNPDNLFLEIPKVLTEISKKFAVREFEGKYRLDKDGAVEYLILEVWPDDEYPNRRFRYDIFTCYCTNWESEGPPPF